MGEAQQKVSRQAASSPAAFPAFGAELLSLAMGATQGGPQRRLAIGPLGLTLAASDPGLLRDFTHGLADLPPVSGSPREALTLHLLAGSAMGRVPPPAWPLPTLQHQHQRRLHLAPDLRLFSWNDGAVWQLHDPRAGAAVYWARDRAAIPE